MSRTEKQAAALKRNHRIRSLHALAALAKVHLRPDSVEQVRRLVDVELTDLGAKTLAEHRDSFEAELRNSGEQL